ncbi:MAG: hypothetical protein MI757_19190 [Pirellulales bacterium]|nr:hypothetical protein [Pirellulales bacterium]
MKTHDFLAHHGIARNPFAEEDAQTDPVFIEHCIASVYHPTWDKIFGDPATPSTSIVFGEKGSGKTAMRLQIAQHIAAYNRDNPRARMFVTEYDDFNPFLDRFRERLPSRKQSSEKALAEWKLWDHMDAILSLATTDLVDRILGEDGGSKEMVDAELVAQLGRHSARDLLLLAAFYDQSTAETLESRWSRLRKKLHFHTWKSKWDIAVGIGVTLLVIVAILANQKWEWLISPWTYVIILAGWLPRLFRMWKWLWEARGVTRQVRIGRHSSNALRKLMMNFTSDEISSQPIPNKQRTDDRYELLHKLQGILEKLNYRGMLVLVDRVDEPHLVNGSAEHMKALLWPMLDNKFLKAPGVGFKLLLPIELGQIIDREGRAFYERARLDKQNLIRSLDWTGEALYDVANARLRACGENPAVTSDVTLESLFEPEVDQRRLINALRTLRVPRHLFKFMYRLLVAHCNAHTDTDPKWQISSEMFESVLASYLREQDAVDRGMRGG